MRGWGFLVLFCGLLLIVCINIAQAQQQASQNTDSVEAIDQRSYAMGVELGRTFKKDQLEFNVDAFEKGLQDVVLGRRTQLSDDQIQEQIVAMQRNALQKQQVEQAKTAEINLANANSFLAANKSRSDIFTTASGLQYKVIEPGSGASPTDQDIVTVDYEGRLFNNEVFDSSYERGKPATFEVSGVIPGWQEALKMMKKDAIWELYIPPQLGYGERGVPGTSIGPNELLIFKVHLISIKK